MFVFEVKMKREIKKGKIGLRKGWVNGKERQGKGKKFLKVWRSKEI